MDIFFYDPDDIPVPPEEVRIRELRVQPYPDGRRVRLYLELTPFVKSPSGELTIRNASGEVSATANIIETVDSRLEMTMHLRVPDPAGEFTLSVEIFYQQADLPEPGSEVDPRLMERKVVDNRELSFNTNNASPQAKS